MPTLYEWDSQGKLNRINLALEIWKGINLLTENTSELQEGEKQEIVKKFRVRLINRILQGLENAK